MIERIHKMGVLAEKVRRFEKARHWYWELRDRVRYMRGIRKLCDAWYYIKCAVWHRYNRVHVKTLPPTWCDRCQLLPHAMFQVLDDFVKRECSPGIVDWNSDEPHRTARAKMDELLNWWHNVYLAFDPYKEIDRSRMSTDEERFVPIGGKDGKADFYEFHMNDYERDFYDEVNRKEAELEKELDVRMKELVELHRWFWT
jgi:hypothetical protein